MENTKNIDKVNEQNILEDFLEFLHNKLDDKKDEVSLGSKMLEIGEKSILVREIEGFLNSPLKSLLSMSSDINYKISEVIDRYVCAFLHHNVDIISLAFKKRVNDSSLYYFIVLKEDSKINRMKIFEFLDYYESVNPSNKHQIYFHFLQKGMEERLKDVLSIELK